MKKLIITLAIVFPLLTNAQTAQQQYESALRQVIALLQQQVAILIAQLNAQNQQIVKIDPTYTYTPITVPSPEPIPAPLPVVTQPQPIMTTQTFGSTPAPLPDYEYSTIQESENTADYSFINRATTTKQYASVTVKVTPRTIVNTFDSIVIRTRIGSNPSSTDYVTVKPTEATNYTIPLTSPFLQSRTSTFSIEVNAYQVPNANDRYLIELVSFN